MKVLIVLYILGSAVLAGLALSGHLVVVSDHITVPVVDDAGKVMFTMPTDRVVYHLEFVRSK